MTNIFNLFLFLLLLWIIFMISSNKFSTGFVLFGALSSMIVAFSSYQLKLFDKKSELLYLSIGFYKHFLTLYFKNFWRSFYVLFNLATFGKTFHPTIRYINLKENYKFNHTLLIATINMNCGLFAINVANNKIAVHCVNDSYFFAFDLLKYTINLNNVNDDNLI